MAMTAMGSVGETRAPNSVACMNGMLRPIPPSTSQVNPAVMKVEARFRELPAGR